MLAGYANPTKAIYKKIKAALAECGYTYSREVVDFDAGECEVLTFTSKHNTIKLTGANGKMWNVLEVDGQTRLYCLPEQNLKLKQYKIVLHNMFVDVVPYVYKRDNNLKHITDKSRI